MPTPSDQPRPADWSARTSETRRSVFGNYQSPDEAAGPGATAADPQDPIPPNKPEPHPADLQAAIDTAMARSFLYRFLAKAYEDPTDLGWLTLTSEDLRTGVAAAVLILAATNSPAVATAAHALLARLKPESLEEHLSAYLACFGHAARGRCPLNEIEYGDIKADPLFQPHRLADLAAFYNAFELSLAQDAQERHDHISLQCEFMCVLTAKEAFALDHKFDSERLAICRDAQKKFLREHLGRWTPAFTRRLTSMAGETSLGALGAFTGAFITAECARFGVDPGSEDLLLRPTDANSESLCASCSPTVA